MVALLQHLLFKFPLEQIPFAIVQSDPLNLDYLLHGPVNVCEFILRNAFVEDLLDGLAKVHLVLLSD